MWLQTDNTLYYRDDQQYGKRWWTGQAMYDYGAWYASNPLVDEKNYILSQSVNLPLEAKIDSTIDIDFMVEINPTYQFDSNIIRQFC